MGAHGINIEQMWAHGALTEKCLKTAPEKHDTQTS